MLKQIYIKRHTIYKKLTYQHSIRFSQTSVASGCGINGHTWCVGTYQENTQEPQQIIIHDDMTYTLAVHAGGSV
jgi:hypothetical protein